MDKDYFNILIFDHTTFGIGRLRIKEETLRIVIYLLAFLQLSVTFFFCDYIQVKKKSFLLNQLREESQVQRSQIQFFSSKIEELEKKLFKLKEISGRIHTIANLEKGHPFIGMGGPPPPMTQMKLKEEPKGSE